MRNRALFHFLTATILLSLAASAPAQTNIQVLADRWASAYNTHDRDALGALYTADARLMLHGSPTIAGRDSIEQFWAQDFTEGDPLTLLNAAFAGRIPLWKKIAVEVNGDFGVLSAFKLEDLSAPFLCSLKCPLRARPVSAQHGHDWPWQ